MKIDKITFKNNQAWVVIKSHDDDYLGTWHVVDTAFVEYIRKINPKDIFFDTGLMDLENEK